MAEGSYIVDTGVFLRWFVPQVGFEHAHEVRDHLLAGRLSLETVDFVRVELANVLRKKGLLSARLDRDQFLSAVRSVDDLGVVIHGTDVEALERAAALAADRRLAVYDALLAHRALDRDLPLLTADAALCRAVQGLVSTELLRGIQIG